MIVSWGEDFVVHRGITAFVCEAAFNRRSINIMGKTP